MQTTTNLKIPGNTDLRLHCELASTALLGEGPWWSQCEQVLYWVDILAPAVHCYDPLQKRNVSITLPSMVGAIAQRKGGGFVAALQSGFAFLNLYTGAVEPIGDPEKHLPGNRFNDGKCDRRGRFWAGTMSVSGEARSGSLYCLNPDGGIECKLSEVGVANGLGWSPDNTVMYFTDSAERTIYAFDFDLDDGTISRRRVFARVPENCGVPDGLTVDSAGAVWSAHWDGWRLTRYQPDGAIDKIVMLPVPRPTSCMFGGVNLETLYVTTARTGLASQRLKNAPLSGSIFAVTANAPGIPEPCFAG